MTREEIISGLKFTVEMFLLNPSTGETYTEPRNDMDKITIDACRGAIEVLKQEPKIGHWIDIMVGDMPAQACDQCKTFYPLSYTGGGHNYCPSCGSRMVEPQ